MTEANEHEKQLVSNFLEKAKTLVPGVKIRYVERVLELGEPGLRIGLALPEGVSLLGNEAFTIDDMAEKFSEAQKYRVTANMTPVAGTGDLLTITSIAKSDCSEDAVVAVPALIATAAISSASPVKKNSSDKGGKGGGTLSVDNSTPIALIVVALLIAVPTAWNYFRAPANQSPYLATSPGPDIPDIKASPPPDEGQERDIGEISTELEKKLGQLQMKLIMQGKKAEADRVGKTREKIMSAIEELGDTKSGDK
jgi:hypothetical protein